MSFMNAIFGVKPANTDPKLLEQQQQQARTNNPNNNPAPQDPHSSQQTSPNGVIPADGATPPAPLDKHKDLWKTDPVDPSKQVAPDGSVDLKKLAEAASKVDFSSQFSAEELAKVQAGGAEGMQALVGLLNKAAQVGYTQSMVAGTKMVNHVVDTKTKAMNSEVPNLVRAQNFNTELLAKTPGLAHPAVAPILENIQQQLSVKHPDATAQELVEMAQEVMVGMANIVNPSSGNSNQNAKPAQDNVDWTAYLG